MPLWGKISLHGGCVLFFIIARYLFTKKILWSVSARASILPWFKAWQNCSGKLGSRDGLYCLTKGNPLYKPVLQAAVKVINFLIKFFVLKQNPVAFILFLPLPMIFSPVFQTNHMTGSGLKKMGEMELHRSQFPILTGTTAGLGKILISTHCMTFHQRNGKRLSINLLRFTPVPTSGSRLLL